MNYVYRYLRHSDDIAEQPNSRMAQLNTINSWLAREREMKPAFALLMDAGEYWDNDCSGGIEIAKRTAGGSMMGRIKRGDVIIASKWDRMFRDCFDLEATVRKVRAMGVRLICVEMNVDTETPEGMLVVRVLVAAAEMERMQASKRTKDGLSVIKHNKGVSLCPLRPPIGWRHARKHSVKRKDGLPYAVLVPDVEERDECRFIAKKYEQDGWNYSQIARYFNEHHRKNSRTGLAKWSYAAIRDRYKASKAGFPAPPDCVEGRNTEQLTVEAPARA